MRIFSGLMLLLLSLPAAAQARLEADTFPAAGSHAVLLHVDAIGRYAVSVTSGHGVALSLADRMSGPIGRMGTVGETDGRLDLVLDAGTYKVLLEGPEEAAGEARLAVRRFEPVDASVPDLLPHTLVDTTLADYQVRSFWVVLTQNDTLRLEIMGRNLSDARLWIPGQWLTGVQPTVTSFEPTPGQPMTHIEFHHRLSPGQYLVTCYGGPDRTWAAGGDAHPLYLRRGIREVGRIGRHRVTVSPFGRESFLVKAPRLYAEVRRGEKEPTSLQMSSFEPDQPRYGNDYAAVIDKNSTAPFVSHYGYAHEQQWLTVTAEPGARLEVQHFPQDLEGMPQSQPFYLSYMPSLLDWDAFEPTGLIYHKGGRVEPSAAAYLGRDRGIGRRTNLTDLLKMYIKVTDTGTYLFETGTDAGADPLVRITPVLTAREDGGEDPWRAPDHRWQLASGTYLLELKPARQGILTFRLRHEAGPEPKVLGPDQVAHGLLLAGELEHNDYEAGYLLPLSDNRPNGVTVRNRPLDLSEDLPFTVPPGGSVALEFAVENNSRLFVEGDPAQITLGDEAYNPDAWLKPGTYSLRLFNSADTTGAYQVYTRPYAPLPPAVDASRWGDVAAGLARLGVAEPLFDTYAAGTPHYYLLDVPAPGLYRLETSGRLHTTLYLRSRVDPDMFRGNGNGIGRNGLIQQYLRRGTYLVTVMPQGRSAGRAGLHLCRAEVDEGAPLVPGTVRKAGLAADAAAAYPFQISEAGTWRLRVLGLGKTFGLRLEDADGFPLEKPGPVTAFTRRLPVGTYRAFSLPEPIASRRLFLLERVPEPRSPEGKGPHRVVLNSETQHQWRQGPADVFRFQLPAQAPLTLTLTRGMQGTLLQDGEVLGTWDGGTPYTIEPAPGLLECRLVRTEEDDRFPYRFGVHTPVLMDGVPVVRDSLPEWVDIRIGKGALVDLTSLGTTDLQASLYDADGRLLAAADDGPDDWNVHLSRRLEPGSYRLVPKSHDQLGGGVRFDLRARPETVQPARDLPFTATMVPDTHMILIPLNLSGEQLVKLHAAANEPVALAVLRNGTQLAAGETTLHMALSGTGTYALMVWFPRGDGGEVTVTAEAIPTEAVDLQAVKRRLPGKGPWRLNDTTHAAWTLGPEADALFAPGWDQALLPPQDDLINLFSGSGLLIGRKPQPTPFTLGSDAEALVPVTAPLVVGLDLDADLPHLIWAEGTGAHPAVELRRTPGDRFFWQGMDRGRRGTLTAAPGAGTYRLRLWPPDPARGGYARVRTQGYALAEAPDLPADTVQTAGNLDAGKALRIPLPDRTLGLNVLLSRGMVAALHRDGRTYAAAAAQEEDTDTVLQAEGGTLLLFNSGDAPASYATREDLGTGVTEVTEAGWEQVFPTPGRLTLRLPEAATALHLLGDDLTAWWLGDDGQAHEVVDAGTLPAGAATLDLHHGGGLVKLWYASAEARERVLCGPDTAPTGSLGPGRVQVAATTTWTYTATEAGLLSLHSDGPALLAVLQGDTPRATAVSGRGGTDLRRYLPAGDYRVLCRPLTDAGVTLTHASALPQDLHNGQPGAMQMLAGGGQALWRFEVTRAGKVGVGLETDRDVLDATLYDAQFQPLGQGPYQMRTLQPGTYLLVVRADTAPARYRPVLYGADGPQSFIPDDVLGRFINP